MPAQPAARVDDCVGGHSGAGSGSRMLLRALEWAAIGAGVSGAIIGASLLAPLVLPAALGAVIAGSVGGVAGATLSLVSGALSGAAMGIRSQRSDEEAHPQKVGGGCSKIHDGSPNVLIEAQAAATVDHVNRHGARALLVEGSATVYCNGKPLSRIGDLSKCRGKVTTGAERTIVGGPPAQGDDGDSAPNPSSDFSLTDPDTWNWSMLETTFGAASLVLTGGSLSAALFGSIKKAGGLVPAVTMVRTKVGAMKVGRAASTIAAGAAVGTAGSMAGGSVAGPMGELIGGSLSQMVPLGRLGHGLEAAPNIRVHEPEVLMPGDPGYAHAGDARLINGAPQLAGPTAANPIAAANAPLLADASPQPPLLTNQVAQPPLLTNQVAQPPLLTNQVAQPPLLTDAKAGQPRLADARPDTPLLTGPAANAVPLDPPLTSNAGAHGSEGAHAAAAPNAEAPNAAAPTTHAAPTKRAEVGPTHPSKPAGRSTTPSHDCPSCSGEGRGLLGDNSRRLGMGKQSHARHVGTTVLKRVRRNQFDDTEGPGVLSLKLRKVMARRMVEVNHTLNDAVGDVIPRAELVRPGVIAQPLVTGKTWADIASDPTLTSAAYRDISRLSRDVHDALGIPSGGNLIKFGMSYGVDHSEANFVYNDDGTVKHWFDPLVIEVADSTMAVAQQNRPTVWQNRDQQQKIVQDEMKRQAQRYNAVEELRGPKANQGVLDDANALFRALSKEGQHDDAQLLYGVDAEGGLIEPIRFRGKDGEPKGRDRVFLAGLLNDDLDSAAARLRETNAIERIQALGGDTPSADVKKLRNKLVKRLQKVVDAGAAAPASPAANGAANNAAGCASCAASAAPRSSVSTASAAQGGGLSPHP